MKYLFIGGDRDGKRIEVEPTHTVVFMKDRPYIPIIIKQEPLAANFETIEYHRLDLRGEKNLHPVYVIHGMTADVAIEKLIEHYQEEQ